MPTLDNPYRDRNGEQWLRGNLHTHTTNSDGARSMQDVIDDYAARGHDFLMISDHDIFTGARQYSQVNSRGMVLIPGNEISAAGPHLLHVNPDRRIEPAALRQQVISDVNATQGFTVVNHPNWQQFFDHCPIARMAEWVGFAGLEIYNGVISRLDGSPYATNKWDMLLGRGRRVWGYANDDSHAAAGDVGLGWNVASVADKSVDAIVNSLATGRFYASTGVTVTNIEADGMHVRVETENAQRIVAYKRYGQRVAVADDSAIEMDIPADAGYVRFECWGPGERFAWTQPMFVGE